MVRLGTQLPPSAQSLLDQSSTPSPCFSPSALEILDLPPETDASDLRPLLSHFEVPSIIINFHSPLSKRVAIISYSDPDTASKTMSLLNGSINISGQDVPLSLRCQHVSSARSKPGPDPAQWLPRKRKQEYSRPLSFREQMRLKRHSKEQYWDYLNSIAQRKNPTRPVANGWGDPALSSGGTAYNLEIDLVQEVGGSSSYSLVKQIEQSPLAAVTRNEKSDAVSTPQEIYQTTSVRAEENSLAHQPAPIPQQSTSNFTTQIWNGTIRLVHPASPPTRIPFVTFSSFHPLHTPFPSIQTAALNLRKGHIGQTKYLLSHPQTRILLAKTETTQPLSSLLFATDGPFQVAVSDNMMVIPSFVIQPVSAEDQESISNALVILYKDVGRLPPRQGEPEVNWKFVLPQFTDVERGNMLSQQRRVLQHFAQDTPSIVEAETLREPSQLQNQPRAIKSPKQNDRSPPGKRRMSGTENLVQGINAHLQGCPPSSSRNRRLSQMSTSSNSSARASLSPPKSSSPSPKPKPPPPQMFIRLSETTYTPLTALLPEPTLPLPPQFLSDYKVYTAHQLGTKCVLVPYGYTLEDYPPKTIRTLARQPLVHRPTALELFLPNPPPEPEHKNVVSEDDEERLAASINVLKRLMSARAERTAPLHPHPSMSRPTAALPSLGPEYSHLMSDNDDLRRNASKTVLKKLLSARTATPSYPPAAPRLSLAGVKQMIVQRAL
ncbi:hypothetical protein DFS34DRAFT_619542 [Phlyctochytrium arcticum]|nr:hypothetical protein DFS34DRAFT_619542 [Phlyctochytrium arcticum]